MNSFESPVGFPGSGGRPSLSGGRGAPRGFTLIEMIMVLVIAGVLMSIVLPGTTRLRNGMQIDSGAQTFMRELMRAQTQAIKKNTPRTVKKLGATTYQVEGLAVTTLPEGVKFASGSADSARFAAFGPPLTGASVFRFELANLTRTVRVTASGLVSVQ